MPGQYPGIPDPTRTVESVHETVLALKEAVELLTGQRGTSATTAIVGTGSGSGFLTAGANLSDVGNAATSRTNLGLGTAAVEDADEFLLVASNLSDLNNAETARTNLSAETLGKFAGINTQTGSYTLVLTDKGKTVEMNVGSANDLTVPLNSSVAFDVGTYINVTQYGAGQTTIVATGGVTLRAYGGALKLTGQYAVATLYKRGTNEWVVGGNLTT